MANYILILTFLLYSTTFSYQLSKTSYGVFFKVINFVQKKNIEQDWYRIRKGDVLYNNDNVRTGKSSIAIIKFTDKSILRMLENSELILLGEKVEKSVKNNLKIVQGTVVFNINKKQNEQYTFTSPTSVASIRGTKGLFNHQDNVDILIVVEGIVTIKNLISGEQKEVKNGNITFSYPDGKFDIREATPDELNGVEQSLKAGDEQKENELNFELHDSNQNKRELKIKYNE